MQEHVNRNTKINISGASSFRHVTPWSRAPVETRRTRPTRFDHVYTFSLDKEGAL